MVVVVVYNQQQRVKFTVKQYSIDVKPFPHPPETRGIN
jgi:hypothetical protein